MPDLRVEQLKTRYDIIKGRASKTKIRCPKAHYIIGGYQMCSEDNCELSKVLGDGRYGCKQKEYQEWIKTMGWT